jgi:hypothetical protein
VGGEETPHATGLLAGGGQHPEGAGWGGSHSLNEAPGVGGGEYMAGGALPAQPAAAGEQLPVDAEGGGGGGSKQPAVGDGDGVGGKNGDGAAWVALDDLHGARRDQQA